MLIGLDGLPLSETLAGVGHYTLELARALALASPSDEFELVSPRPFVYGLDIEDEQHRPSNLRSVRAQVGPLGRRWFLFGLPRYIRQRQFTLFHGTNYEVPLIKSCPTVLTIHDLSLLLHPETHEKARVRRSRRRLPLMARAATIVVTPTESVRREVCEHLSIEGERVVAVPEAPRSIFRPRPDAETRSLRSKLGIGDDFLLFVGTIEPRKNLLTLVHAFREVLQETKVRLQLVIAGQTGWLADELFAKVKELGLSQTVVLTGYLPDDDLCALYSSCRAFVYPSLYEGFGLPPLEAMACGAPVVASRIESISEVVGDAAMLFAPTDTAELTRSIIALLQDENLRRRMSDKGLRRAAAFSWQRTAQLMREVYEEALRRESVQPG
ncbi:MAG TPA: glycosyltransferase family 1 protein [Pyrinomonadaceae bacterium]|jgi:glycosyltransferase involved in cell wall biosynthesis